MIKHWAVLCPVWHLDKLQGLIVPIEATGSLKEWGDMMEHLELKMEKLRLSFP
jgi:hypothetical protein